jgi:hypothetical protein
MIGHTYDAGALIAAERNDRALWVLHRSLLAHRRRPTVPTTVLAQAWRSGQQARLAQLLEGCRVEPFTELAARQVGEALRRSGTSDIVDASVVVTAARRREAIVTGDVADLRHVAQAIGARVELISV